IDNNYKNNKTNENVIISLTSFPARIDKVWIVIETLLRQTKSPNKIILWLAESEFNSIDDLPNNLLEQQEYGLEIKFCENLRSHKKYYYSMKCYPESIIITVDDDTFYPENLVEKLLNAHKKYPKAVCCNLAHLITSKNGNIAPYKEWESGSPGYKGPSFNLIPIGCEGVLYPPNSLNDNVFDKNKIKSICPKADDLWLKSMATINKVKTVKTNKTSIDYANLLTAKSGSLNSINVDKDLNDKQLANIIEEYPELRDVWN
ncbi:hypothetical protein, partial [Halanaerobium sp.]|uniref:hypothetical protein n=1 Tax=Halanaerobium sp. TaxID=1895664 RepID=UPI000DE6B4EE